MLQLPLKFEQHGVSKVRKLKLRRVNQRGWLLPNPNQLVQLTISHGMSFNYFFGDNVFKEIADGLNSSPMGKYQHVCGGTVLVDAEVSFQPHVSSRLTEQLEKVDGCLKLCFDAPTTDNNMSQDRAAFRKAMFSLLARAGGSGSPPLFAGSKIGYSYTEECSECCCFMFLSSDNQRLELFGSRRTPIID